MTGEYHSVLLPLEDIYHLGGSKVFKGLARKKEGKKNLIIFPEGINKILEKEKRGGNQDTMEFIDSLEGKIKYNKNGITIHDIADGIDLAYISHTGENGEIFSLELEKIIQNKWKTRPKIITHNPNQSLRYRAKNLEVERPNFLTVNSDIVHEGIILGNNKLYSKLYENKRKISVENAEEILERNLYLNQFIKFIGKTGHEYARVSGTINWNKDKTKIIGVENTLVKFLDKDEYGRKLKLGETYQDNILGTRPRDMEQYLAMQYGILNPDVEVAFICGSQGSGKTILSYPAAVDLILKYDKEWRKKRGLGDEKDAFFDNIVLFKPTDSVGGRELGFEPGNLWKKLKHHYESFIMVHEKSNLNGFRFEEMILHPKWANDWGEKRTEVGKINGLAYLPPNNEAIKIVHSARIRGQSHSKTLFIADEAQNYLPYELKAMIERLDHGSKIIIMGDPNQIDNPKCSKDINGLTSAIKHYLPRPQTSLFYLPNNYRSQSSQDALDWHVYHS